MDLITLFSYVILGFFSSLPTAQGQWGINWGWLPGSLGTLKPVRLHGHHRIFKESKVLWRPLKHDLVLEHDSSDSSDDSDGYKHRLIRKLKRRLSKKRRVNVKRKKANIIIEMLIRKKLLAKNKRQSSGNTVVKNNVPGPRIHKIDKIKNNVKVISKFKLVDRLGERFLTDFYYPDVDVARTSSSSKSFVGNRLPINEANVNPATVTSQNQNTQSELTNFNEIKHTSGGSNINKIKHQNQQIEIGENEYEEENLNVKQGKSATEEPEIEETSTAKDVATNIFQHVTASAKTSQDDGEQEIEAEETTTKASTTQTSKTVQQSTVEQEIEAEETTTRPSITKTTPSTSKTASTGEQEIEAEDTTTQSAIKSTTPFRRTTPQWNKKMLGVDGARNTISLGHDKTNKPGAGSKIDLSQSHKTSKINFGKTQEITHGIGKTQDITHGIGKTQEISHGIGKTKEITHGIGKTQEITHGIPSTNDTFKFRAVSSSSMTDNKLSTGMRGIQTKSGVNKIIKGFTVGSPSPEATIKNKPEKDGKIFSDNFLNKQTDSVIGQEKHIPKALGSNHPPIPAAEAVLSVPGEPVVISEPGMSSATRDSSLSSKVSNANVGSAQSNPKQIVPSLSRFGSGRPSITDNGKPQPGSQGTQNKNNLLQINKNVNNIGREKLEFSGKIFNSKPSINLEKMTLKSPVSKHNNEISSAKKTMTDISSRNIHGDKHRNILKSNINGRERSNLKHLPFPKKLQKHGITHLQPVQGHTMQKDMHQLNSGRKAPKGLTDNNLFPITVNNKLKHGQGNILSFPTDKTSMNKIATVSTFTGRGHINKNSHPMNKIAKDSTFIGSGHINKNSHALSALKSIIGSLNNIINATQSKGGFPNSQNIHKVRGGNQHDKTVVRTDKTGLSTDKPGLRIDKPGLRIDKPGLRTDNQGLRTDKPLDLQHKLLQSVSKIKLLPEVANKMHQNPTTLQWHHKATSKPIVNDGVSFKNSTGMSGGIKWHHRATSKPLFAESHSKTPKPQPNIAWGPKATSRPVTPRIQGNAIPRQNNADTRIQGNAIPRQNNADTRIQGNPIPRQNNADISWQKRSSIISVGKPERRLIQSEINKNHISGGRQTIPPKLKSPVRKPAKQIASVSRDLLDLLRHQNTRNLGSNRGRVTIMDVGNSSKVLPISNKQATSKINNKIQADETLTNKWVKSVRPQAVELATELEGTWKDANMTMIGGAASTCPVYKILYQNNSVVFDTIDNKCRTVITWHKKTKREQIRENTWFGVNVYYRDRPYYIPLVTYIDLAKV